MSSAAPPALPGVTFEVERFEWASDDRLEVVGRWFGLRGHRFLRPTLDVEAAGERRRMLAVLEHKPWAAEEGEEWMAAFAWTGERAKLDDAELTVSPDLAVQLPLPDVSVDDPGAEPAAPAAERRPARRPRTAVLEGELAAALAEVGRLTEELARERESHSEGTRELRERARVAQEAAKKLESELERASGRIATAEAQAECRLATAAVEAESGLEQLREERDAAATARDRAGAEAEAARAERDAALQKLAVIESERDALAEARDRARQERNAWMSRARAATTAGRSSAPVSVRVPPPTEPVRPPTERAAPPPERVSPPTELAAPPTERDAPPTERVAAPAQGAAPPAEPPATAPPSERRTIQIGERPGPVKPAPIADAGARPSREIWTPRLVAVVALLAFVVVVALLLLLAL